LLESIFEVRLVAKYTFVLVTALGVATAALAYFHVQRNQQHFEDDMRTDHRVVGHVLQSLLEDIFAGAAERGSARANEVIQLANTGGGATRFEWLAGAVMAEDQRIEGHEFVSRFPVHLQRVVGGTLVVRESLEDYDRLFRAEVVDTLVSFGVVVVLCLIASLTLGRWLVGKPIGKLVAKARRIARRDFSGSVDARRKDELGDLGAEMNAMSDALAGALDAISKETEARVRAVDQLRHAERLATVGRLAAGLAHELGTPLSIVSGHAQMIAGREVAGDAVVTSARTIDRESDRMGRIVRELLDFARRKNPHGSACDTVEVARRCLALLGPMVDQASITTRVETSNDSIRGVIDEDSLQHVLTNLAVNAVQAMPCGGTLRVALSRTRSRRDGEGTAHDRVRIDVADTGGGIAGDVLPHIFEPFFTTKQPGEGTGLGLAVVYGIVDDHRGLIEVDTGPRGTTFSVFLPEAAP
jgi:signal transduction histidine kinase